MLNLNDPWFYFCICTGCMFLSTSLMGKQGEHFFTQDPLIRKFSIIEMEFPAKKMDLSELINGIYLIPDKSKKVIKALKIQLLLDYLLFVPSTYGAIFVMCMEVSRTLSNQFGVYLFIALAWAQCLCFLLDYVENTFFWFIINKPQLLDGREQRIFRIFQVLEITKWGFALLGGIGGISAISFFWLSGYYSHSSLKYVLIFGLEITSFFLFNISTTKDNRT